MVEQLVPIGMFVIIVGFAILLAGVILTASKSKGKIDFAFGGFIGPIPFGFSNREDLLKLIIVVTILFLLLFVVLNLLGR